MKLIKIIAVSLTLVGGIASLTGNVWAQGEGPLHQHHVLVPRISQEEVAGLKYMREEEKLARDVYSVFYDLYSIPVFNNISNSEQWHMDQILILLERYGIGDPAQGTEPGEFLNEDLQSLYYFLIEYGMNSVINAMTVGALIEEVDILDLEEHIRHSTHSDIQTTYGNLMWASGNHLKAFVGHLAFRGITYEPVLLDWETYAEIINR